MNIESITRGFVTYFDLSKESDLGLRFDWVMSLETAEHIPLQFENNVIGNLVRHSFKGK